MRLVGSDGKQVGVVKIEEALKKAKDEGLTLVEVAPLAKPPVAKIVEFGKFRYQEEKKAKEAKQEAKAQKHTTKAKDPGFHRMALKK